MGLYRFWRGEKMNNDPRRKVILFAILLGALAFVGTSSVAVLSVEHLSDKAGRFHDVSFAVKAGEIF